MFLGELSEETALSGVDQGALLALVAYIAIVGGCAALLWRRYRDGRRVSEHGVRAGPPGPVRSTMRAQ